VSGGELIAFGSRFHDAAPGKSAEMKAFWLEMQKEVA
jgi:hypothetical protein